MSPSEYPTSQPSSTTKKRFDDLDDDLLESLQNIPSNFDLALNGGTNRTFLSPEIHKTADSTQLLDPETFRRLSISTISSIGGHHSRNVSPYPIPSTQTPRTLQSRLSNFWKGNQGLFLVSFSQLFGALMNVTTRLLELEGEGMHPLQVLFARMFLTMIFCCGWMRWKRVEDFPFGARGIRWLLVARGASGFFGIYGMYYSLQYLPVADAVVITFLAPSVASYGCYLFLKEPFPRSAQYASLISLLGVVLIARPTSFFSSPSSTTPLPVPTNSTTSQPIDATFPIPTSAQRASAVAVALVGVLGAAGAFTTIRWIGKRAHPLISVNYFSLVCVVISTLSLLLAQPLHLSSTLSFKLPASLRQWSMLIFLGICGFVMQFLLTKGLAVNGRGGGAKATHFIYTNMLFALALDKVVFGVSPGAWSLAGSGLILGSAVFVAVRKGKGEVPRIEESEEGEARHGAVGEHGTEEEEMGILRGRDVERSGVEEDDEVDNRGRESVLVDVERGELVGLRDMTPRPE